MDFPLENINTGDILLSSSKRPYPLRFSQIFTGCYVDHTAIALWIKTEKNDIVTIFTENITDKFRLRYEKGCQLYIFDMAYGLRLAPLEKLERYSDRCLHRPLVFDNDELHLNRFKKFFTRNKYYNDVGLNQDQFLMVWLVPMDHKYDYIFQAESCVSFVLLWLISLGYHHTQNVPDIARQLYRPEHLLTNYTDNQILSETQNIIFNNRKIFSDIEYVIIIMTLLFLLLTIIFVVRNIFILIPYFIGIKILFGKLKVTGF